MPAEQQADLEMGLNVQLRLLRTVKLRAGPRALCALKMSLAVMIEEAFLQVCSPLFS